MRFHTKKTEVIRFENRGTKLYCMQISGGRRCLQMGSTEYGSMHASFLQPTNDQRENE